MPIWLARTPTEHERGLAGVLLVSESDGMLFVFDPPRAGPFWNAGTLTELDIAFLEEDGTIRCIHPIRSLHTTGGAVEKTWPCDPARPYRYALEMANGWFRRHGLGPGSRVDVHQMLAYSRRRP